MPPKQRFNAEDIINAAFNVVRQKGWEGLSARSIAKELGSSTRPIYSYLDSMKNLEEEVVKKALDLFYEYLTADVTGDKWLDQAIGYVTFAIEEKQLFRCINDAKHAKIQRRHTRQMWESLGSDLSDYELFKNMTDSQVTRAREMRWFFIHGLSSLVNNGWFSLKEVASHTVLEERNIRLTNVLKLVNQVLYEGFKDDKIFKMIGIETDGSEKTESDSGK